MFGGFLDSVFQIRQISNFYRADTFVYRIPKYEIKMCQIGAP